MPAQLSKFRTVATTLAIGLLACGDPTVATDGPDDETGDGDGDGDGETGDGDGDELPEPIIPLASTWRTCAITPDAAAQCWGFGRDGQLGDGMSGEGHFQLAPTPLVGVDAPVIDICGGGFHTCVVTEGGAAWCFGTAFEGALGTGVLGELLEPAAVMVTELGPAAQIDCGSNFTCARVEPDEAWCWGNGASGRLGVGSTDDTAVPVQTLAADVSDVATGSDHACAVVAGEVWCWGSNVNWQLGDPDPGSGSLLPIPVPGLPAGIVDVELGSATSCAVDADGGLWCWGDNEDGQLGIGSDNQQVFTPSPVELPGPVISVSGGYRSVCAVVDGGAAYCWGNGAVGQLGDAQSGPDHRSNVPVGVTGLESGVMQVSVGRTHACASTDDGRMLCWGSGDYGELGDGIDGSGHLSAIPVEVMGL